MEEKRERDCNFVTDLTLGLVDTLRSVGGVQDVSVVVRAGVERAGVVAWEQRNNVTLPQALKSFYAATDGFKLTWNYATAGKVVGLGNLELLPLGRVNRLGSGRGSGDPLAPSLTDLALAEDSTTMSTPTASSPALSSVSVLPTPTQFITSAPSPAFSSAPGPSTSSSSPLPPTFHASKMFEVDSCQGYGKVVLAYPGRGETFREGSYWFVDPSLHPHLLAVDTHTYWRLVLAHLGMPQWQALVAGLGLTPWARQWYEVVASYLVEGPRPPRLVPAHQDSSPAVRLDPAVFRTRRTTHKAKHAKDHQTKEQTKLKELGKEKPREQPKEQNSKDKEHIKGETKEKENNKELSANEHLMEQGKIQQWRENVSELAKENRYNGDVKDQPLEPIKHTREQDTDHQTKDGVKEQVLEQPAKENDDANSKCKVDEEKVNKYEHHEIKEEEID